MFPRLEIETGIRVMYLPPPEIHLKEPGPDSPVVGRDEPVGAFLHVREKETT